MVFPFSQIRKITLKERDKVKKLKKIIRLLFVTLNKLSAINCCPEQKPIRDKKSGKTAPDVL